VVAQERPDTELWPSQAGPDTIAFMRSGTRHPRPLTAAFTAMWIIVALHGARALVGFGGAEMRSFCETWVYTAAEVMAVAICIVRVCTQRANRLAWALVAFGMLAWTAGDLVWTLWLDDLSDPPFPSLADPLYLAMYPAMYAAFMLLIRSQRGRFRPEQWLDGVIIGLSLAAVGAGLILPSVLAESQGHFFGDAVNLAYPLGDLALLMLVVVAFALSSWRPDRLWVWLGAAMAVDAVSDLVFTYMQAKGTYVAGSILDTSWPAAMALVAVASWQKPRRRDAERPIAGFSEIVLPAAFVSLAVVLLVDAALTRITPTAVALAAAALVMGIARAVLTFMENVRILRRSAEDAVTDGLTGLGNRRRLMSDLDDAVARADPDHPYTLVFFDLNGFKNYNDTLGHGAGDVLLARLGSALEQAIAGSGRAYRLGGDEFCALLRGRFSLDDGLVRAATSALAERCDLADISAALGMAVIPAEADTTSDALQLADQRMYASKTRGSRDAVACTRQLLMQVLAERAPDLQDHVAGVGQLVRTLGHSFGLDAATLDQLVLAAELHDVGKLGIPDTILGKPGPLDDEEWTLMRSHPEIGERILSADPAMQTVSRLVRSSHERWDGAGYPDRLAGPEIPLGARIIAACDALEAMTSNRCYQAARSLPDALSELRRCAGTQFDPDVVAALCTRLEVATAVREPSPATSLA
jgi:diguanylate cyclase (GGDEF)-like protein